MKKLLHFFSLKTPEERESAEDRLRKAGQILHSELTRHRIDGTPVSHRRLESLMLAAGTTKGETVRLLRSIGARPSSRNGGAMWTLKPKP